ncbi:hypothetical protein Ahy_B03g062039 isoform A [Arachis hypogaea]|uniref:Uncharacterized protein n=1 Tax=Arachis hypogaea TaxID=3818 RepID=A0A444ZT48_ARAHY|nr:hypothetical protein Ahy_B03g062039 isoform A [Arachis hypogaea]
MLSRNKGGMASGGIVRIKRIYQQAKPKLVGIHERVKSDNSSQQPASASSSTPEGGKRMPTATNPNAEFWARSLRCHRRKNFLSAPLPTTPTSPFLYGREIGEDEFERLGEETKRRRFRLQRLVCPVTKCSMPPGLRYVPPHRHLCQLSLFRPVQTAEFNGRT